MGDIPGLSAATERAVLERFKDVRHILAPGIDRSLQSFRSVIWIMGSGTVLERRSCEGEV